MFTLLAALASSVALGFLGCSSGALSAAPSFSCDQRSSCTNQPGPMQADIDSCKLELSGACGAEAKALFTCQAKQEKCKPDGTRDDQATNDQCLSQLDAHQQCAASDAGGG